LLHLRAGEIALFEQAQKSVAGALGVSQSELLDGLRLEAAANQIRARRLARRAVEIGAKALRAISCIWNSASRSRDSSSAYCERLGMGMPLRSASSLRASWQGSEALASP
jgi:hypothetical protein